MGRGIGLISLVASLVVSGLLFSSQLGQNSASGRSQGNRAIQEAQIVRATFTARSADTALGVFHGASGTYVGADLSSAPGVRLLNADAASYCLAILQDGETYYERGPNGDVVTQPC